jgi:surfactin synthase thioesterase subunit
MPLLDRYKRSYGKPRDRNFSAGPELPHGGHPHVLRHEPRRLVHVPDHSIEYGSRGARRVWVNCFHSAGRTAASTSLSNCFRCYRCTVDLIPFVCLPFAGAGASFFYPWNEKAGQEIEIVPIQLPGREWRIDEEPYQDVNTAVNELFPDIAGELGTGPVMLFGHSLGAVLAYELAHRFSAAPGFDVARLIVSGSPGPWTRRARRATGLPDSDFLYRVSEFAQYNAETMQNPEVRKLVLPTLRADVKMHEEYVSGTSDLLSAPITSLRGHDDQLVTADHAAEWAKATSREFELRELPGSHMYITQGADEILRLAGDAASQLRNAPGQTASAR